ncbi:MAG: TolC family protein [Acidobacteria bacterium]|nr:TolC family protein [Acidobacteriota bacterium]
MAALCAGGCAPHTPAIATDPAAALQQRTGANARTERTAPADLPAGIVVDDGLTADEAVAVALWNSPGFQVSVSDLGFARADLLEAGLLTNPVLSLLFPVGPKQLEATLRWPIEVLWERPRRVAAARLALDVAAQRLVQAGLDLVVSVRLAYTDLALAVDRQQLAREAAALLTRIDTLMQSRLATGDISELEARAARIDAARASQDADRTAYDIEIMRGRLRLLLGLPVDSGTVTLAPVPGPAPCAPAVTLLRDALIARPDVRAAELALQGAAARLGWEQSRILTLTAVLDANGRGVDGFEAGPGVDASLPIFNRNQGGRARAAAELQRSAAAYALIQQQVAVEIREAGAQVAQATESRGAWRERIIGPLQANLADAERSFAEGETSYLFVLENSRRLTEARLRERELEADTQRARARIERAIGRTCDAPPLEVARDR